TDGPSQQPVAYRAGSLRLALRSVAAAAVHAAADAAESVRRAASLHAFLRRPAAAASGVRDAPAVRRADAAHVWRRDAADGRAFAAGPDADAADGRPDAPAADAAGGYGRPAAAFADDAASWRRTSSDAPPRPVADAAAGQRL